MLERFVREMKIENPAEGFPFTLPIVKNTRSIAFDADVTFFVGENGTGKSTVLEALALALGLNAEGAALTLPLKRRRRTAAFLSTCGWCAA